mgnify:CR=1 FL=1
MKQLIFNLIGGTALLMYGVDMMGEGLEKASGNLMRKMLSILTGNVISSFLVGIFLTALVQSSTAITVLAVGFVNAGLIALPQALGIIYGANIGTTVTAQLMALSFNFKLTEVALPVVGIGFAISIFAKRKSIKHTGEAIMGFGLMFLGLSILNSSIPFMKDNETLRFFFENYASNPIIAVLLGIIATALVHSSAATVGLVMVLGQAGLLNLESAICIMLGDNIGTCISAQLASLTGNINARRTAWAHTLYNVFGVIMVSIVFPFFVKAVVYITSILQPNGGLEAQIANSHTFFNLFSALIFLPSTKFYVKFLETVIRPKKIDEERHAIYLDKLLLDTPPAALKASLAELKRGADISKNMLNNAWSALVTNDEGKLEEVVREEDIINQLQQDITMYMVELSKQPLSKSDSITLHSMIDSINNLERMADHTTDIGESIATKIEKNIIFSEAATNEIKELYNLSIEMIDKTIELLDSENFETLKFVVNAETKMDELTERFSDHHIERLENGKCSIESGVVYLDIVSHFERVADLIYTVALASMDELKGISR